MERIKSLTNQVTKQDTNNKLYQQQPPQRKSLLQSQNEELNGNDNSALLWNFKKQMSMIQHYKSMMMIAIDPKYTEKFIETPTARLGDYAAQNLKSTDLYLYKLDLLHPKSPNAKSPKEGWFFLRIPFSTDEYLRFRFSNIDSTTTRIGKILELMDYCAGIASFRHIQKPDGTMPVSVVTGSLDNVRFFQKIPVDKDLYVQGYPTWIGSSSMEVRIDLYGEINGTIDTKYVLYGCAFFQMVARPTKTQPHYQIPRLEFDDDDDREKCQLRWELGKAHQQVRLHQKTDNLFKNPPTAEESIELHKLWQDSKASPQTIARIKDTNAFKQIVMHHQDKNIYSMVFGGVVLREAYDSAFSAVYLFSGEEPDLFHIDDVKFLKGVQIGSLVNYHAQITYTENHLAHVKVIITKIDPSEHLKFQKTTEVHLTMFSKKELKPVYPKTYEEAVDYLDGKRRITRISNSL